MASLTLKNLPEPMLIALRAAAERDRRSVTQQIIYLLDGALRGQVERKPRRKPDASAQLASWRKLAGKWDSDVEPAVEVAQLRRARTSGRKVDL